MAIGGSGRWLARFSFGGRVPGGLGLVLTLTVVVSLVVAFGSRHTADLFALSELVPELVLRGQVWRLVTWGLVELSPLRLLFAALMLYWFGRELAEEWGSRRFLRVYGATALASAVATCLVALVDHDAMEQRYIGAWPLAAAVTVAWGLWFPDRVIRIWFVLPLRGVFVAWLTIALTCVSAIYFGWEHFLPALFAEGAMLAWLFRRPIAARLARIERAARARQAAAASRASAEKRRSSEEVLRSLEAKDHDLAPLPPELEEVLGGKKTREK